MAREIIQTDAAPAAIGPYSQAVRVGEGVYISGQIPLHPSSMTLVEGDMDAQIDQVIANLKAIAEAAGGGLEQIVKITAYLTDLNEFARVNARMEAHFSPPYPARAAVGVAALPKGAHIEMDAILLLDH